MAGYIVKVERVDAPQKGNNLWVDLLFDKRSGIFFSKVNGKTVEAKSKDEAVALTKEALRAVTQVQWREVILLRVAERRDNNVSHENNRPVFSASCDFTMIDLAELRKLRENAALRHRDRISE